MIVFVFVLAMGVLRKARKVFEPNVLKKINCVRMLNHFDNIFMLCLKQRHTTTLNNYCIVKSRNMCYYSWNQVFGGDSNCNKVRKIVYRKTVIQGMMRRNNWTSATLIITMRPLFKCMCDHGHSGIKTEYIKVKGPIYRTTGEVITCRVCQVTY